MEAFDQVEAIRALKANIGWKCLQQYALKRVNEITAADISHGAPDHLKSYRLALVEVFGLTAPYLEPTDSFIEEAIKHLNLSQQEEPGGNRDDGL